MPIRFRWLTPLSILLVSLAPEPSCAKDTPVTQPDSSSVETPVIDGDGRAGTITVSPETKFQTMDGFGTTLKLWDDPHLNGLGAQPTGGMILTDAEKDSIFDLLYSPTKGIGLNRLRVPIILPGWQTAQGAPITSEAPYPGPHATQMMDFIAKAKARNPDFRTGFEVIRFDGWITQNEFPLVIARYIKSGLDYARAKGHEPDWVGIQNEPSGSPPGLSAANLRDIAIELKNILKADNYSTRISIPDDITDVQGAAKAAVILDDPDARSAVSSLSIHLYNDETPTQMAALAEKYKLPLWMTEYDNESHDSELGWASTIVHEMIVTYNASAVDMLWGFFKSSTGADYGAAYIGLHSNNTTYTGHRLSPWYFQMGQWSKFVKRGSVRIAASSSSPSVKVSAFIKDGKKIIVLIHSGDASESFAIPSGSYRAIRTQISGTDRLTDKGLYKSAITLPRMSITTLVEQ